MSATVIPWITSGEKAVGHGHPTLVDVDNRPLRTLLTLNGQPPDTTFTGLIGPVYNVKAYGAVGNNVADDTAAIQAALDAADAAGSGIVWFPAGTYYTTATLVVGGFTTLQGTGLYGSIIYKSHTGDCFQVHGNYNHFIEMFVYGDSVRSTTYSTTGYALNFSTASSGYACTWMGGGIDNCDLMLRFGQDAGHAFRCTGGFFRQYATAPGSEQDAIWVTGDTTAAFRQFTGIIMFSRFRLDSASDTLIVGCAIRTVLSDAGTQILIIQSTVMANNNNPHSISGGAVSVIGCRISGSVTLGAGSSGSWFGNVFTFGGLTDNSGTPGNWNIVGNTGIPNYLTGDMVITGDITGSGNQYSFGTGLQYTDRVMHVGSQPSTGVTQFGLLSDCRGSALATALIIGLYAKTGTDASAYTCAEVEAIRAVCPVLGAGSTITKAVGITVESITTGATNYAIETGTGLVKLGGALQTVLLAPTETTLVSGVNVLAGNSIKVTLTAARVVGAPISPSTGQRLSFLFLQNGTGGWAVTWNAVFKVSWSDTGNTANKRSSIVFEYDGTNWNQVGAQSPYI